MDNYHTRKELMTFLNHLEQKYPVDQWKINGIGFWPLIRIELAFNVLSQSRNIPDKLGNRTSTVEKKKKLLNGPFAFLARNISQLLSFVKLFFKLKKYDHVFAGAISHRQLINGKYYNKSYDAIIEDLGHGGQKVLIVEYSNRQFYTGKKLNYENQIIFQEDYFGIFNKIYRYFVKKRTRKTCAFPEYDNFLKEVSESRIFSDSLKQRFSRGVAVHLDNCFYEIYLFYHFCFKVIKPKAVFGLCYYDVSMLAMFAAASKLKIPSFEIQHGPQNSLHPAYGSWEKLPAMGYDMHPEYFWTWDEKSKKAIGNGIGKNDKSKVLNLGNPWHQFWQRDLSNSKNYTFDKNIILISMQPLESYLDDFVIDTIKKTHDKYHWWVRIHPRQQDIKEKIVDFFIENGIENMINYEQATNYPLPLILNHTGIHITKTSGTTLEAMSFGVKTIIVHDLGKEYYKDLIEEGKVVLPQKKTSSELITLIENEINKSYQKEMHGLVNYSEQLEKIIRN